jgi:integrase
MFAQGKEKRKGSRSGLGSQASLFKRAKGHRPHWRTGYMAIAYLLQCLGDIRDYGPVKVTHLAHRVFGEQTVKKAETQVLELLSQWGYGKSKAPALKVCLHELFLINHSPRLEDFTFELVEKRFSEPGPKSRRVGLYRISLAAHQLGLIEKPLTHSFAVPRGGAEENVRDGIDPRWLAFMDRWAATTTVEKSTRHLIFYTGLKCGRWLTQTHPDQASPELWTRQTAAEYVAAVCRLKFGSWANRVRDKDRHGKPLKASSIAGYLMALRILFRDATEWEWFPRRFDPRLCLRPPLTIRQKIDPNPRTIADDVWAKLVWAGMNFTEEDVCVARGTQSCYPLALLRAAAMIWLFAGLRSDEIFRLPVGAITWGPYKKEEGGGQRICYLQVPLGKTNVSFVKPVDSIVGDAIESWEKVRPVQPSQLDEKSAAMVDFLLATRTRRLNRRYLNRALIGALCRKAGVPRTDARGLITSHRARTTIASQLYNAKEPLTLFELQAWLGHRSPVSTQFYANIKPTKLAKAFEDAGYFERNLRAIDVLIDQAAVRQGLSGGEPWKYYDLGHGYCTYDFFDQCAHRMACAKCSFYLPKESSAASLLEGKENLLRLRQRIPLLEAEIAAIDDGVQCFDALLRGLETVPTPTGQTPSELRSDLIQITQTTQKSGDR